MQSCWKCLCSALKLIKVGKKFTGILSVFISPFCGPRVIPPPHVAGLHARVSDIETDSHPNPLINLVLAPLWGPMVAPPYSRNYWEAGWLVGDVLCTLRHASSSSPDRNSLKLARILAINHHQSKQKLPHKKEWKWTKPRELFANGTFAQVQFI